MNSKNMKTQNNFMMDGNFQISWILQK